MRPIPNCAPTAAPDHPITPGIRMHMQLAFGCRKGESSSNLYIAGPMLIVRRERSALRPLGAAPCQRAFL